MRSGLGDLNLALSSFISHYISLHHPHTVMTLPRQNWAPSAEKELSKQAGLGAPSQRCQSPALTKGLLGAGDN